MIKLYDRSISTFRENGKTIGLIGLTIPLLRLYNGERGSWKGMGKLFYAYYPAHLAACGILRIVLWGVGFVTAAGNF